MDLKSTNGVFVNGQRRREHLLEADDMIEFGKLETESVVYMFKAVHPEKVSPVALPSLFSPGCPPPRLL